MSAWWTTRTPRERSLIAGAMLLAAAAIAYQFALLPTMSHVTAAKEARERAAQTLQRMERIAGRGVSGQAVIASNRPGNVQELRIAAEAEAREAVLEINEAATTDSGAVRFVLAPAEPQRIFIWIGNVETRLGANVSSATISSTGDGRVNAVIEFTSGGIT